MAGEGATDRVRGSLQGPQLPGLVEEGSIRAGLTAAPVASSPSRQQDRLLKQPPGRQADLVPAPAASF